MCPKFFKFLGDLRKWSGWSMSSNVPLRMTSWKLILPGEEALNGCISYCTTLFWKHISLHSKLNGIENKSYMCKKKIFYLKCRRLSSQSSINRLHKRESTWPIWASEFYLNYENYLDECFPTPLFWHIWFSLCFVWLFLFLTI